MHLAELATHLLPVFPSSMQKDVKTAVGYLAHALGCSTPQQCSPELYNQPLAALYRRLEEYQHAQGKGAHTIRNTKNAISRLFREAACQHLFSLVPQVLTKRFPLKPRPPRPGSAGNRHNGTYLMYRDWPPELQDAFTAFATWATAPVVSGRDASLRKRPISIESNYRKPFEAYFGFLARVQQLPTVTFDQLFDVDLVSAYVHWHINEIHHRPTGTTQRFLESLLALTRQYRPLPEVRAQLVLLRKTLPKPAPVYNKEDAWVPMDTLDEIGRALWPRKQPHELRQDNGHPGLKTAVHAGLSLLFRLWSLRPYRQRNICEMKLGDNLYKDAAGAWRITFRSEQLKIATRRGRANIFDLAFPETLVPVLEEYLSVWRPILLKKSEQPWPHVFLTKHGTPLKVRGLHETTSIIVYRYTGKKWHPHIVRTVWATEYIRLTGDFYEAARMLNDRFETVIATYAHLRDDDVAVKADRLIEERRRQSK